MKHLFAILALLNIAVYAQSKPQEPVKIVTAPTETTINVNYPQPQKEQKKQTPAKLESKGSISKEQVLEKDRDIVISVVGQGVAPINTVSPAQAYALAKRAAVADAYRLIAEKVKGVRVDGQDLIRNMMVKRSTIRTSVQAMVRNANIVETNFKEGLCEVEMEIVLSYSQFAQ